MLLSWSAYQPSHSCCPGPQHQSIACHTQDLQHFVKADVGAPVPALPVLADMVEPFAPTSLAHVQPPTPASTGHAPPDILSLRV
jgi:hypothetical protein